MANENFKQALDNAGITVEELADTIQVDPKTVARWVAGRTPYARHRRSIARTLGTPEHQIWPDTTPPPEASLQETEPQTPANHGHSNANNNIDKPGPADNEVTRTWGRSDAPTATSPITLFENASDQIDMLNTWPETLLIPELVETVQAAADRGCRIRMLCGAPDDLGPLIGYPGIDIRVQNTKSPLVVRADQTMLIPIPIGGGPDLGPMIEIQRHTKDGLFDRAASHYQDLWDAGTPVTNPTPATTSQAHRRWPGRRS